METTESMAISSLSVYMYFADISIVNSGCVRLMHMCIT